MPIFTPAARFGLALPQVVVYRGELFYKNNCADHYNIIEFINSDTMILGHLVVTCHLVHFDAKLKAARLP